MAGAREWIGERGDKDSLDLAQIKVDTAAADLTSIFTLEGVKGLFRIRVEASGAARRAQERFKRWTKIAIISGAVAALASALLLYGAGSDVGASTSGTLPAAAAAASSSAKIEQGVVALVKTYRLVIVVFQILGLALSAYATVILSQLKLADLWSVNRNKAERLRPDIFNAVLSEAQKRVPAPLPNPDFSNPVSQALEFFRRYQHELQITFYTKGSQRHAGAMEKLAYWAAGLAAVAAITGAIGSLGGPALTIGAFLGIAVPIVAAAVQSWNSASGDSDKVAAYTTAKEALDRILVQEVDAVREQAARGDVAAVRAYFDKVHLVMTTEHDAWKATGAKPPKPGPG